MKILFLSDDFPPNSLGGAGIVAHNLAKAIKELGHDVYVVSATQDRSGEGSYVQDGLKVCKIYSEYHRRWRAYRSLYNPYTVKKVRKVIADIKPDVVHAHNIHSHLSYYCLKIAKLAGASVFLTAHDVMLFNYGKIKIPAEATCENYFDYCGSSAWGQIKEYKKRYNPVRNLIIKRYLQKYVNKIIAVSDALKRVLVLNGITNMVVIHNGIDVNAQEVDLGAVLNFKKINNLENKKIILFGGRISEDKGINQAMESLQLILKEVPDALLLIAGSDGSGINKTTLPIKFMGWLGQEDMKIAIAASDVVLVPSICFDTFGMIVLEAMAARKPVVATCFGGTPEIVIGGETGHIVNPYDIETTTDKIADLLKNTGEAESFGRKGYERAKNDFSLKQQAEKYLELYVSKNKK